MAESTEHVATVRPLRIPRPSRKTTYVVDCDCCGRVGSEQDYPGDAQAHAERHNDVQGFEGGTPRFGL